MPLLTPLLKTKSAASRDIAGEAATSHVCQVVAERKEAMSAFSILIYKHLSD